MSSPRLEGGLVEEVIAGQLPVVVLRAGGAELMTSFVAKMSSQVARGGCRRRPEPGRRRTSTSTSQGSGRSTGSVGRNRPFSKTARMVCGMDRVLFRAILQFGHDPKAVENGWAHHVDLAKNRLQFGHGPEALEIYGKFAVPP